MGSETVEEVRVVLDPSVKPSGSRAAARNAVVRPGSGNSPARPEPGIGRSPADAAQGWQYAVSPRAGETRANGDLIAAGAAP